VIYHSEPFPQWCDQRGTVQVRFVGRGPEGERAQVFATLEPTLDLPVAWAKQVHADQVLPARSGRCGEGDALITDQPGLVLSVVVADCVPVLLAGERELAAVHAGWRGLAAGVISRTLESLTAPAADLTAWIGPAIGPCCYEVSDEVAAAVVVASTPLARRTGAGQRPHLDLLAAAREQLARAGVTDVRAVDVCTRCHADQLWSYRREGPGGGRNHGFVWRA
jgi:YfiH family protein